MRGEEGAVLGLGENNGVVTSENQMVVFSVHFVLLDPKALESL